MYVLYLGYKGTPGFEYRPGGASPQGSLKNILKIFRVRTAGGSWPESSAGVSAVETGQLYA